MIGRDGPERRTTAHCAARRALQRTLGHPPRTRSPERQLLGGNTDAFNRAPAVPVEAPRSPQHDEDVADAEHVGQRPARGNGEHVAEECEPWVWQDAGVGELCGCDVDPGPAQGFGRGGQRPPVQGDRHGVAACSDGQQSEPGDVPVVPHEDPGEPVRGEVGADQERTGCIAFDDVGDQDLDGEGEKQQRCRAQPQLGQAAQVTTSQRDQREAEQHAPAHQHREPRVPSGPDASSLSCPEGAPGRAVGGGGVACT